MGQIILYIAQSLDGMIALSDGSVEWLDQFQGEDYGYHQFLESVDIVVMGNKTYRQVLSFGIEFPYKDKEVYVFTNEKNKQNDEFSKYISDNHDGFIRDLRNWDKNTWLVGGADIIDFFLKNKAIDELWLFTMPVILGRGIHLFKENRFENKLKLTYNKAYNSGVTESHYKFLFI
ncbi:MAG: dihydrofolate reductase family protein [Bacteroidales bacterium]